MISLIGYFDLDPNRALDIILDVLSVHLATHYSFFVALLSFSPWSASYRRPNTDSEAMTIDLAPGSFKGKTLDEVLTLADRKTRDTVTVSTGSSPRVLAQVLGFKFAYYHVRLFVSLGYHTLTPDSLLRSLRRRQKTFT